MRGGGGLRKPSVTHAFTPLPSLSPLHPHPSKLESDTYAVRKLHRSQSQHYHNNIKVACLRYCNHALAQSTPRTPSLSPLALYVLPSSLVRHQRCTDPDDSTHDVCAAPSPLSLCAIALPCSCVGNIPNHSFPPSLHRHPLPSPAPSHLARLPPQEATR